MPKPIYISGPMTGLPGYNYDTFNQAEAQLHTAGYNTLNPARHGQHPNKTWCDYMRLALHDLAEAHGIALLPGWENSRGARLEADIAHALDLPCHDLEHWLGGAS